MIEKAVYARVAAHGGLSALVSARVYPGVLPQKPTYPALTYQVISDLPAARAMGADPGVLRARVQITAWSENHDEAILTVGAQIRDCFQRWRGTGNSVVVQDTYFLNRLVQQMPVFDTGASGRGVWQAAYDFEFVYEG